MQRSASTRLAAVFALLSAGAAHGQANFDRVTIGKESERGKILSLGKDEVVLQTQGIDRKFPVNTITRLTFAEDPNELRQARSDIEQGQLEEAQKNLAKINLANVQNRFVRQEVEYLRAYAQAKLALAGATNKLNAWNNLGNFLAKYKDATHHYYEAAELWGDLAVSLGKYDQAATAYGVIAKAPWPAYQMRANVLKGQALLGKQEYNEALALFDTVIGGAVATTEGQRQQAFAKIGKAAALANLNKPQEGIKLAEEIIKNYDDSDYQMFARAYNAIGACYQAMNQPKDAILAYLRVHLLFNQDGQSHAEALYYLSQLWKAANRTDDAAKAARLLRERYAGSVWATKAS